MKHLLLSFSALLLALVATAAPVSQQKTDRIASAFFRERGGMDSLVEISSDFANLRIYVGDKGRGFVILPTDDAMAPILGYSANSPFAIDNMADATRGWLEMFDREIDYLQDNDIEPTDEVRDEWNKLERLAQGRLSRLPAVTARRVDNILTTTWNQAPYYNAMCPYDSTAGGRTVTGCLPTAVAQIMKYWNYPPTGIGSNTYQRDNVGTITADFSTGNYDWANMPDHLDENSTATQVNAVAKLMYHVGVALEAMYEVGGTGTLWFNSTRLIDFFGYRRTMSHYHSLGVELSEWKDIIRRELNEKRPVLYCNEGHAFVCSGYDDIDRFWMNWGWGGYCDGYFYMTSGNPLGSIDTIAHCIYVNIESNPAPDSLTVVTTVRNKLHGGSETGAGTYVSFRDTVRLTATANPGYKFRFWNNHIAHNPLEFTADGVSDTYIADYEKIEGYRMGYCNSSFAYYLLGLDSVDWQWGIRLDPISLSSDRQLTDVEFFRGCNSEQLLRIYQGGDTMPLRQVYVDTLPALAPEDTFYYRLDTFTLARPYLVDHTQSLWITFEATDCWYPFAISQPYSGNKDGCWLVCNHDSVWRYLGRDVVIYAHFEDVPKEPATVYSPEAKEYMVTSSGNMVNVYGAEGQRVAVYDSLGRLVISRECLSSSESFVIGSGVYFVRINGETSKVIVE